MGASHRHDPHHTFHYRNYQCQCATQYLRVHRKFNMRQYYGSRSRLHEPDHCIACGWWRSGRIQWLHNKTIIKTGRTHYAPWLDKSRISKRTPVLFITLEEWNRSIYASVYGTIFFKVIFSKSNTERTKGQMKKRENHAKKKVRTWIKYNSKRTSFKRTLNTTLYPLASQHMSLHPLRALGLG